MTAAEEIAHLQRVVDQLGEHYDTVHVFVIRYDTEKGTLFRALGSGNYYARYGQQPTRH